MGTVAALVAARREILLASGRRAAARSARTRLLTFIQKGAELRAEGAVHRLGDSGRYGVARLNR
jgi:hypothetical protein